MKVSLIFHLGRFQIDLTNDKDVPEAEPAATPLGFTGEIA